MVAVAEVDARHRRTAGHSGARCDDVDVVVMVIRRTGVVVVSVAVLVVVLVMRCVPRLVMLVVRVGRAVRVGRQLAVKAQVQVRRELEAQQPQHHAP